MIAGSAGARSARRVAEALRARGAECLVADVGDARDARRIADDFGSASGALHRLLLLGPGTAAHHALAALLVDRLIEGGTPAYGAGSKRPSEPERRARDHWPSRSAGGWAGLREASARESHRRCSGPAIWAARPA
jgi:hypothetical protein